jgi:hypothetical protein
MMSSRAGCKGVTGSYNFKAPCRQYLDSTPYRAQLDARTEALPHTVEEDGRGELLGAGVELRAYQEQRKKLDNFFLREILQTACDKERNRGHPSGACVNLQTHCWNRIPLFGVHASACPPAKRREPVLFGVHALACLAATMKEIC